MNLRYKIYLIGALLAGVFLWGRCSRTKYPSVPVPATVLPKDDKERITIDPIKRIVTRTTEKGTETFTLPDRTVTFDLKKTGEITVTAPQFGFERLPFAGASYSDKMRAGVGVDLVYWKKLDLNVGLSSSLNIHDFRVFVGVSYNVYHNIHLGLTFDNQKFVGGILYARI